MTRKPRHSQERVRVLTIAVPMPNVDYRMFHMLLLLMLLW